MPQIVSIINRKGRRGQAILSLDDGSALVLRLEVVGSVGLSPGKSLSGDEMAELLRVSNLAQARADALRYLSYRPRSQREMKAYLQRRGYDESVSSLVIEELTDKGLVDDVAFAHFWSQSRESSRPRSARLVRLELMRKGVERGIAEEATVGLSDAQQAYKSGAKRARSLANLSYAEFRRRLEGYLQRRGFSYRVIKDTVDALWRESRGDSHSILDSIDA